MRREHKIGIIGFGCMGQHLSSMLLEQGHTIFVYDSKLDAIQIQTIYEYNKDLAHLFPQAVCCFNCFPFDLFTYHANKELKNVVLPKFNTVGNLTELLSQGCNIVIEATAEDINGKRAVFQELTSILQQQGVPPSDALLCSTTLNWTITSICSDAIEEYKPRCIGFRISLDECGQHFTVITYQNDQQANADYAKDLLQGPIEVLVEDHYRALYQTLVMTVPGPGSSHAL